MANEEKRGGVCNQMQGGGQCSAPFFPFFRACPTSRDVQRGGTNSKVERDGRKICTNIVREIDRRCEKIYSK